MKHLLPNIVKDLVFDGTLYHLWYLPAAVIGAAAAWTLVKKLGMKRALAVTVLLYTVGLFGDSYYGAAEKIPLFWSFYSGIFEISDYTRNGIFLRRCFCDGRDYRRTDCPHLAENMYRRDCGFIIPDAGRRHESALFSDAKTRQHVCNAFTCHVFSVYSPDILERGRGLRNL